MPNLTSARRTCMYALKFPAAFAWIVAALLLYRRPAGAEVSQGVKVRLAVVMDTPQTTVLVTVYNGSAKPLAAVEPANEYSTPVIIDEAGHVLKETPVYDSIPTTREIKPGESYSWTIDTSTQSTAFDLMRKRKGTFRVYWLFRGWGSARQFKSNEILLLNK